MRIPTLEPTRGTRRHVGELLDASAHRRGAGGGADPQADRSRALVGVLRGRVPVPDLAGVASVGSVRGTDGEGDVMAQEQTKRQGGGGGDDDDGARRRGGRSGAREKLGEDVDTSSTRSTTCWRRTPRTSSGPTSRRAASDLAARRARHPLHPVPDVPRTKRGTHLTMEFRPPVPHPAWRLPAPGPSSFTDFVARQRAAPAARPRARAAAGRGRVGRARRAARHHDRRADLRRRRGDRRRPAGHHGQHDRPARHREGVHHRLVLGRRHRRHGRHRGRDGAAVHRRARALREDRGRPALPGRQGQPAGRA